MSHTMTNIMISEYDLTNNSLWM